MKFRIIGSLVLLAVLFGLYFLTSTGDNHVTRTQSSPIVPSSSDNDFKTLKIN